MGDEGGCTGKSVKLSDKLECEEETTDENWGGGAKQTERHRFRRVFCLSDE